MKDKKIKPLKYLPSILDKKIKHIPYVGLTTEKNDTGKTKHYTPASQEWVNSIYAYNKNYNKLLSTAHLNIMKILKSYFNLFIRNRVIKIKRRITRFKRFSAKKIFVGKGELKHTSDKVIITFYVYNTEKKFLFAKIKKLIKSLYYPKYRIKNFIVSDKKGNSVLSYNRAFTLNEFLIWPNQYKLYLFSITNLVNKLTLYLGIIFEYYNILTMLVETKVLSEKEKFFLFNKKVTNVYTFKYPDFNLYLKKIKYAYLENLRKLMYLLEFNKAKFQKTFIFEVTRLAQRIYNKKVEFNIVNLKEMHLNSDIFTQLVSLKLKNRKNRLYKVLKTSLRKIKISNAPIIKGDFSKYNKNDLLENKIRNNRISTMSCFRLCIESNAWNNKDSLNNLLVSFFPSLDKSRLRITGLYNNNNALRSKEKSYIPLKDYIFKSLKHNKIAGVRLEVKGRLTKRFTASRSLFKMKWKGGLRNIDSSFNKLPVVILRGNAKSNIQYSALSSKNRNGAFGIKGWISNR